MRRLRLPSIVALIRALAAPGLVVEAAKPPPGVRVPYVSFLTLHDKSLTVAGRLMVPRRAQGKVPAVLIVHGANGPDSRGPAMAEVLTKPEIATLEIDMWAPRSLVVGPTSRPPQVTETLPDAFAALTFLAGHPAIDAARTGLVGSSFAGRIAMLTASKPLADRYGPPALRSNAQAALYPLWKSSEN